MMENCGVLYTEQPNNRETQSNHDNTGITLKQISLFCFEFTIDSTDSLQYSDLSIENL